MPITVMNPKSFALVLIPLILGVSVCRSNSDFGRPGNAMVPTDDGSVLLADNEIIPQEHVDDIEPVHGSLQPNEHGMRIRRASDGGNVSMTEDEENEDGTLETIQAPSSIASSTTVPSSTTANDITDDASFEAYLIDFLKKNPDAKLLRSPKNFDNQSKMWTLSVKGGRNVEVIIHLLDINRWSNFLSIRAVQQDSSLATKISGPITQKNPQKIIEMDTQEIVVHYEFTNSESSKYKGFVLTYKSIGEPASNDESGNSTVTIPLEEYSNMKVLLEVPEAKQNNDTLAQLRLLFAQSANKFIEGEKLAVEQCKIENVRFLDVLRCPMTWPNAVNCIQIVVAIPLKTITNVTASKADTRNTSSTETDVDIDSERIEYELTFAHLIKMWILYGRKHFIENEFIEFAPPNPKNLIMLWTSVCLAVLLVFLLLLYCILKIDLLKDYRRMHWKISDDQSRMCKQSEIDISMFPSPHQAVPTLFPNDLPAYSTAPNTDGGLPFEYVNQSISFSQCDFKRRGSLEQSLKLDDDAIEKHEAGVVPFQSEIIDFNEPHAEDEITFSRAPAESPRGHIQFRTSANNDSVS